MTPELSWEYLQSIPAEPLPRLVSMSEAAWVEAWHSQVRKALDSGLVGIDLYDAWPDSWPIKQEVWEQKVRAQWARGVEYDRLTAERQAERRRS